jgi:hypothetical protein
VIGLFIVNGIVVAISGGLAASRFGTATVTFGIGFELEWMRRTFSKDRSWGNRRVRPLPASVRIADLQQRPASVGSADTA